MAYNAAERKDVRRAEKDQRLAQRSADEVVFQLMSTTFGREWLFNQLGPVFATPYTPDPTSTAFNCGIQSVALALMAQLVRVAPSEFILMMRESNDRSNSAASQRTGREDANGGDQGRPGTEDGADDPDDRAGQDVRSSHDYN